MNNTLKLIFDFLAAAVSCFILASLLHTQFVLHGLIELDVVIDWQTRLSASGKDILGLLPSYGTLISIALLIAFLCVFFLNKVFTQPKVWLYPIAGAAAMFTMLAAMQPVMDITLIAGARSNLGIAAQSLAGVFGGWVFMYQRGRRSSAV
ncbi:hypothetical protein [Aliiglaciecola lipolytica]|uniref:Uncharacterized protein n=1 Tax=Aliiglaciecola lipolytica E3 TaxID=1127673 RepID=K6WXF6_9ALTE|nr:hypothetical protein [Aliiglaciecola lipolytica]GAC13144.1 hypothetical protein GLIP_0498 [Aliiglaciecola lipolytica E3]